MADSTEPFVTIHLDAPLKAQATVQPANAPSAIAVSWAESAQKALRSPFASLRVPIPLSAEELRTGALTLRLVDKKRDATITALVPYAQLAARHVRPDADWSVPWQQLLSRAQVAPAPSPDALPPAPAQGVAVELRDKKGRLQGTAFLLCHAQGVAPLVDGIGATVLAEREAAYRALKELAQAAKNPGPNAQTAASYLNAPLVSALSTRLRTLVPPQKHAEKKPKEKKDEKKEEKKKSDKEEKRNKGKKEEKKEVLAKAADKDKEDAKKPKGRLLEPEVLAETQKVVELLQALTQVDVALRGRLVAANLLPLLLEAASCGVLQLELGFLECLKPFFTFAAHQEALADAGALDQLIALVASDASSALQLKALEVLLYFDEGYQRNMIAAGLLTRLVAILQDAESGAALQTKALEVVQFFDQRYQEQILSPALLTQLASLLDAHATPGSPSSDKFAVTLVLKLLSVIGRFDGAHQKRLVAQGLLNPLVSLLKSTQSRIRSKTLEVLRNLDASHRNDLIKANFLAAVPGLLADEVVDIQLADHLAQLMAAGLVKAIAQALPASSDTLALRMFELLETLDAPVGELVSAGLHVSLVTVLGRSPLFNPAMRATKQLAVPANFDLFFDSGLFKTLLVRATHPGQQDQALHAFALVRLLTDARPDEAFGKYQAGTALLVRLSIVKVTEARNLPLEREILKLLLAHKGQLGKPEFNQFLRSRVLTRILKPLRDAVVNPEYAKLVVDLLDYLAASRNLLPLLEQIPALEDVLPQDARSLVVWEPLSPPYPDDVIDAVTISKDNTIRLAAPVNVTLRTKAPLPATGQWRWSLKLTLPADALAAQAPFTVNIGVMLRSAQVAEELGQTVHSAALVYNHSTRQTQFRQSNADQVYGKGTPLTSGDVISVLWDSSTGELAFAINNDELGLIGRVNSDVFPAISVSGVRASFEVVTTQMPPSTKREDKFAAAKELRRWVDLGPSLSDLEQDWVLLYRASSHGWSSRTFHRLCDARGPTAVFASLQTGHEFGGFTLESWAEAYRSSRTEFEEHEFIFSLTDGQGRQPQKLSPTLPVAYANPPTYSGPQFGASDLVFNLDTPTNSLGLGMQAYKQVPGGQQTWLAGAYTYWTFNDLEVWGLRGAQKRVLEDLLVLLVSGSTVVTDGIKALFARLQADIPRLRRLVSESLRALIARGKRFRALPLLSAWQLKLEALPYEVIAINGFSLSRLAVPPINYKDANVVLENSTLFALRRGLDVDSLHSLRTDMGGAFVPRHGSLVHLVLQYKGDLEDEKTLPFLTHAVMRRGYEYVIPQLDPFSAPSSSNFARRALIFTSNEAPVLQPLHRVMPRVTARLFRQAYRDAAAETASDSDSDCELGDDALPEVQPDARARPAKQGRAAFRELVTDDYAISSDEENWSDDESVVAARSRKPETEEEIKARKEKEAKEAEDKAADAKKSAEEKEKQEQERLKATTPGLPELLGMGFEFQLALIAAQRHPDSLERAIDDLVSRSDMLRQTLASRNTAVPAPPTSLPVSVARDPALKLRKRRTQKHSTRPVAPSKASDPQERRSAFLTWLRALPGALQPVAFVDMRNPPPVEARFLKATQARYVHILLVARGALAARQAPSLSFLALVGYQADAAAPALAPTPAPPKPSNAPSLLPAPPSTAVLVGTRPEPEEFLEVASALGIMSSARQCRYDPIDLTTGILYHLGMRSGRNYWLNPLSVRGVNAHVELLSPNLQPGNYQNLAAYGTYTYDMDLRAKQPSNPTEFTFKFRDRLLVTNLVIRSGRANYNQFTEWTLEGSMDGVTWDVLYEGQEAQQWRAWHQVFHYPLTDLGATKFATHFRFTFFSAGISLSGIEFYGLITR